MTIKKRINLLNGIAYTLIAIQVLGFLGNIGKKEEAIFTNPAVMIGYYIGSNLFLIIAIILFLKARSLRKKNRDFKNQSDLINSIGEPE